MKSNKITRPAPYPGAIISSNNKDWLNEVRDTHVNPLYDHLGEIPNSPRLVPTLISSTETRDPVNLYTCEICLGSGDSPIFSLEMDSRLNGVKSTGQQVYPQAMKCTTCAGRGTPPISIGELR